MWGIRQEGRGEVERERRLYFYRARAVCFKQDMYWPLVGLTDYYCLLFYTANYYSTQFI